MAEPYSKKQQIYQAGARLFNEKGYAATSMRELAVKVQLEVSSLYSHISSKGEILQHICFGLANQYLEGVELIFAGTNNPKQKIRDIIELHLKIIVDNKTHFNVFHKEYIHLAEVPRSEFLKIRKTYEKQCVAVIKEGIKLGQFKNIDPEFVMKTLFQSMSWVHEYHQPNKGSDLKLINKYMYKLLVTGITKKKK